MAGNELNKNILKMKENFRRFKRKKTKYNKRLNNDRIK